jgi:hypothetical protein
MANGAPRIRFNPFFIERKPRAAGDPVAFRFLGGGGNDHKILYFENEGLFIPSRFVIKTGGFIVEWMNGAQERNPGFISWPLHVSSPFKHVYDEI